MLVGRFKINENGSYVVEVRVIGERDQLFIPIMRFDLDIRDISRCYDAMIKAGDLRFTEPEMLRFQWRVQGGEWKEALSIGIIVQATSVSLSVSEPPAETL